MTGSSSSLIRDVEAAGVSVVIVVVLYKDGPVLMPLSVLVLLYNVVCPVMSTFLYVVCPAMSLSLSALSVAATVGWSTDTSSAVSRADGNEGFDLTAAATSVDSEHYSHTITNTICLCV